MRSRHRFPNPFETPPAISRAALGWGDLLRTYHRHEIEGLAHLRAALQTGRPVLLIGNHCMDVADPLMLRTAIYRKTGWLVRFIAHELMFFRLTPLRELMTAAGVIPSRDLERAERELRDEGLLMLYPGAGAEAALRSYRREPYRLKWYGRTGFVTLALRTRATILFVAGVGIDEMYYQTDFRVPDRLFELVKGGYLESYRGLRLQLGVLGPHLFPAVLPLPVRVSHAISAPLTLDLATDPSDSAAVERAQIRIWAECQQHLDRAVAGRGGESDLVDRALRTGERLLQTIGV